MAQSYHRLLARLGVLLNFFVDGETRLQAVIPRQSWLSSRATTCWAAASWRYLRMTRTCTTQTLRFAVDVIRVRGTTPMLGPTKLRGRRLHRNLRRKIKTPRSRQRLDLRTSNVVILLLI
jgi:hypothetical protein